MFIHSFSGSASHLPFVFSVIRNLIANYFENNRLFQTFFKQTSSNICWFQLLNVRTFCFSFSSMLVYEDSLGFRLFVGQKKLF